MTSADQYIEFWSEFEEDVAPFVHSRDRNILLNGRDKARLSAPLLNAPSQWVDAANDKNRKALHLTLLPMPYAGDLRRASVIICMLNPGLAAGDFYAEYQHAEYRSRLLTAIKQTFEPDGYPFFWLDPALCWTGGAIWWNDKLQGIIGEAARRWSCPYSKAARRISRQLAMVEAFPYHSKDFGFGHVMDTLPSCRSAKMFVQNVAADSEKLIVITRQAAHWGIVGNGSNRIVYTGGQARGAHLTTGSTGGRAILEHLLETG